MSIQTTVGCNIRTMRERAGLSQEKLAELAGVHRTYLCNIEQGYINTTIEKIYRIALALDVDLFKMFIKESDRVVPVRIQEGERYVLCEKTERGFQFYPIQVRDCTLALYLFSVLTEYGFEGEELISRFNKIEAETLFFIKRAIQLEADRPEKPETKNEQQFKRDNW